MQIAFIGHGGVGAPLADHLQRLGHDVVVAVRDAAALSVRRLLERNPGLKAAPTMEAVRGAEIVFLCTPFGASRDIVTPLAEALSGKVLVDCTNPVGPGLKHGLDSVQSGSEWLQSLAPAARVVKSFSIYGFENLEDHAFPAANVNPVMMFCGDDPAAKRMVGTLIQQLAWQPLDVGPLKQALHLEHLTLLWIRMVRQGGHSPHLVWAMLTR